MTLQSEIVGNPNYRAMLDHGFVGLKDYMGTDISVVEAARCSYGDGTRTLNEDRGLIRYLMRNRHSTPFEMCELKFHVRMPIFVARQWLRHRTACLAGDVAVQFELPQRARKGKSGSYPLTVAQIYDRFQPSRNIGRPDRQLNPYHKRDRLKSMLLRSYNEETGELYHTRITDIWQNGIKPIHRLTFSDGSVLRATSDHLCYTENGWLKLGDAIQQGAKFACFRRDVGFSSSPVEFSAEELVSEEYRLSNLATGSARENASDRMMGGTSQHLTICFENPVSAVEDGEEMTYDISVAGPFHNFSAGNVVVHNSVNEESARYSIMRDEFYIPAPGVIKPQAKDNKQGRDGELEEADIAGSILTMSASTKQSYANYKLLIGEGGDGPVDPMFTEEFPGIARELARTVVPVAAYTELFWKANLHNVLNFLRLRADPHAQYEIRVYAEAMIDLITPHFPIVMEAWNDYVRGALTLSRMEREMLSDLLDPPEGLSPAQYLRFLINRNESEKDFAAAHGMSLREFREFRTTWKLA